MTEPPISPVLNLFRDPVGDAGTALGAASAAPTAVPTGTRPGPVGARVPQVPHLAQPRGPVVAEPAPALPYPRAERRADERRGCRDGRDGSPRLDLGEACTAYMEALVALMLERGSSAYRLMLGRAVADRGEIARLEVARGRARSARELASARRTEQATAPHPSGEASECEARIRARRLARAQAAERAALEQAAQAAADREAQVDARLAELRTWLDQAPRELSAELDQLAYHTLRRLNTYTGELSKAHRDPRIEAELPRIVEVRVAAARVQLEEMVAVRAPVAVLEPSPAEQAS